MSDNAWKSLALTGVLSLAFWMAALFVASGLAYDQLLAAFFDGDGGVSVLLFQYSFLPRSAVGFLAGAALGLAGAIMQQALRNPLVSPSTLGISAGAQLALAATLIWMPDLIGSGRALVAMGGAAVAVTIVLLLSARSGFAPVTVLLTGIVVALLAGTLSAALVLFNEYSLGGLFIWGSGSLLQDGWTANRQILTVLAASLVLITIFRRSLILIGLGEGAASLGFPSAWARLCFLCLTVMLTGVVAGHVGMIGFIGLAAPALCRAFGFRTAPTVTLASSLAGGFLLSATDSMLQILEAITGISLPTGAVTALLGGPLLIFMVRRIRGFSAPVGNTAGSYRNERPRLLIAVLALSLPVLLLASLAINVMPDGRLGIPSPDMLSALMPWRWPRIVASLSAGVLLACSGLILQRLTGNPAASPEILGVSSGAALGLAVAVFFVSVPGYGVQLGATAAGSGLVLGLLLIFATRTPGSPTTLLLTGVALGALVSAILAILMASGDPRMMLIANWMQGSTYDAEPALAIGLPIAGVFLFAIMVTCVRWLDLLPMGNAVAHAMGVPVRTARFLLLGLAATMAGAATLAVGPLSFIGLMAPHLALRLGLVRALPHMTGTALIGAAIMVMADWLGRNLWFPFQIPAGLLASLIGSPALIWLLSKRHQGA